MVSSLDADCARDRLQPSKQRLGTSCGSVHVEQYRGTISCDRLHSLVRKGKYYFPGEKREAHRLMKLVAQLISGGSGI